MTNIRSYLMTIDEAWLSKWFVDNYIRKCSQICPGNISRLFDDVSTTAKLFSAVSAVVVWRLYNSLSELWDELIVEKFRITRQVYDYSLTVRSFVCWTNELTKIDIHIYLFTLLQ